jgi:hypothetical protein
MIANSRKSSAETALQSATAITTVEEEEIVPSLKRFLNAQESKVLKIAKSQTFLASSTG